MRCDVFLSRCATFNRWRAIRRGPPTLDCAASSNVADSAISHGASLQTSQLCSMSSQPTFSDARTKAAPALGEHGHELRGEAHELRRDVHACAAADGQGVASVVAARDGHVRAHHGSRQAMHHRRHAEDGLADRGLRKTDAELTAERGGPRAASARRSSRRWSGAGWRRRRCSSTRRARPRRSGPG